MLACRWQEAWGGEKAGGGPPHRKKAPPPFLRFLAVFFGARWAMLEDPEPALTAWTSERDLGQLQFEGHAGVQ